MYTICSAILPRIDCAICIDLGANPQFLVIANDSGIPTAMYLYFTAATEYNNAYLIDNISNEQLMK